MQSLRHKSNTTGVTLVELIVAIVLIMIISLTSVEFLNQYYRLSLNTTKKLMIANLARAKMEELYMSDPEGWTTGSDTITLLNKVYNRSWTKSNGTDYVKMKIIVQ